MAVTGDQSELDDRFPTGEWTGFYIQPDGNKRYAMNCELQFASGVISGGGDDVVGEFSIRGTYDTSTADCSWSKQYLGKHAVNYVGQARDRGIVGLWQISENPEFWTGPFFLWPQALGDLKSAFERAFMEYELSKTFADDFKFDPLADS